jgi:hypothetical protein
VLCCRIIQVVRCTSVGDVEEYDVTRNVGGGETLDKRWWWASPA